MKLRDLVEGVKREVGENAGEAGAFILDLSFTAKKNKEGEVECDFIDASDYSMVRRESLHRLKLRCTAKPARKICAMFAIEVIVNECVVAHQCLDNVGAQQVVIVDQDALANR